MKAKLQVKKVTFEMALGWLRRSKRVRRRAWHPASSIFRVGSDVFVQLPQTGPLGSRVPSVWRPYPQDFLATDWVQVR